MEPIRSIIVPIDFSDLSQAAVARAVTLARLDGASIHLVHAVGIPLVSAPHMAPIPASVWMGVRKAAEENLEGVRKTIEDEGIELVTAKIVDSSNAVKVIGRAATVHEADLIVMGTHGEGGLTRAFLGNVAERTLRIIDCPVLAVKEAPAKAAEPITRILVAVDFSAHSDRAVEVAAGLAQRLGASLDLIHAFELPRDYVPYTAPFAVEFAQKIQANASERLESVGERLKETQLPVTLHVRRGYPSDVIAEAAEEIGCQLIVMGTRGHTGLSHVMLGSIAERTLRAAPCSVLAVKADEAEAPRGDG